MIMFNKDTLSEDVKADELSGKKKVKYFVNYNNQWRCNFKLK